MIDIVLTPQQKTELLAISHDHEALLLLMCDDQTLLESKLTLRKNYIKETEVLKIKDPRDFQAEKKLYEDIKTVSTVITDLEKKLAPHNEAMKLIGKRSSDLYNNILEKYSNATISEITEALRKV